MATRAGATRRRLPDPARQPTPMGSRRPRRRSGWLKGILAVLLVVAISFGAFYLMRNVGVRLERTEDGVTLSMTNQEQTGRAGTGRAADPGAVRVGTDGHADGRAAADAAAAHTGRVCRLGHEAQHRLKPGKLRHDVFRRGRRAVLQDIYSSVIDSVVSISSMTSSGTSSGTGIIMSSDGYVITNHHVITGRARHLGSHKRQSGV